MIVIFSSDKYFESIAKKLSQSNLSVDLLVSESPKRAGRGMHKTLNPAHQYAVEIGLKVLTPEKLDLQFKEELLGIIEKNKVRVGLVFAYGKIIPQNIIDLFEKKIINIHPSILPKYRGPSPIQTAILNNDKQTGYSIILIDDGCDTGPILTTKQIQISPQDDYTSLKKKILDQSINDLPKIIEKYLNDKLKPRAQVKNKNKITKKINKMDGLILSNDSSISAILKIRAFNEFPRAFLQIGDVKVIICEAHLDKNKLIIDRLQIPGKKTITFGEFKNGYPDLLTKFPPYVKI